MSPETTCTQSKTQLTNHCEGGRGTPQGILSCMVYIGMYGPKPHGFLPFWSEIGYCFWPFQSEIVVGYGRSVD